MNLLFWAVFIILKLITAFCDDCPEKLFESISMSDPNLTENCGGKCRILDRVIDVEGTKWSGFRSRNRYFFFPNWQCREQIRENSSLGLIAQATENSCVIFKREYIRDTSVNKCLIKYNLEMCRKNNGSAVNGAILSVTPSSENCSTNDFPTKSGGGEGGKGGAKNEISPSLHASSPRPAVGIPLLITYAFNNRIRKRATGKATEIVPGATSGAISSAPIREKTSGQTNSSNLHLIDGASPCKRNEMFFNNYCYYLKVHKYIGQVSKANAKETFLPEFSANSTKSCNHQNPNALGLAVETKKENRLVLNFLKDLQLHIRSPILTSGIKEKNLPGQWQDWDLPVDEEVINCTSAYASELMLYTIDPASFTWRLVNISSIETFNENNNEWFVMCKRPHHRRYIENELHKKCLKLYRASQCYNPFKFVDYCCAVGDNGEFWFGCPNEICTKEGTDGLECTWNCNDDGMFVQEYPTCRKKTACRAKFNGVEYSAPVERHALAGCPNSLFGYSTWYCASNRTFLGTPNYVCCSTEKTCKTVDPYLNIWIGCPSTKAQKRISCPSETLLQQATAEWFCRKDAVFEGIYPDYSNCNKTNVVCIKNDKYGREWKAAAGSLVKKNCPDHQKEKCFWMCNKKGEFETWEPDCSKCRVKWMDTVSDKIRIGTNYKEVMEIIENHTKTEDLTMGFSHVLNLTSDSVDLFRKQSTGNETAFNEFLKDYSRILKNTAGKSAIWSTLLVSRRRKYADRILKTTQNATFAHLTFRSANPRSRDEKENGFNASFAYYETDGFDFFVQYGPSLSGLKFPLKNHDESHWRLEVEKVNETGFEFAAMGLIMNHSLSRLMFPLGNETSDLEMNSPAVTFTVAASKMGRAILVPDVHLSVTFKHLTETRLPKSKIIRRRLHEGEKPSGIMGSTLCYYFRNPEWTTEGCSVMETSEGMTKCKCDHLSTIGILMGVHQYEPDPVLETVSLVSSSVSIVSLALSLCVFFAFDTIKNERVLIGVNLCVCLLAGHFLLITVMDKRFFYIPDSLCTGYAVLLHYAFMAAFAWMFIEGCHLYRMLVFVFESNMEFRLIYMAMGYGMPLLVVGFTELVGIAFHEQPYGQDELCWLKIPNYVWAFNGPVVVLTSINFVILIMAMKLAIASTTKSKKSYFSNLKTWIKGCISLSALLGITWLIGLAYIYYNQLFAYTFVILNGLQGFFIFFFRCLCNVQYKTAFFKLFKSRFPMSGGFGNYKKLENFKSGSKLFAITQSGIKSSGFESVSTFLNRSTDKEVQSRENFAERLFRFSRIDAKDQIENRLAVEESSSGIGLDFDGMVPSSRNGTLRSRLSMANVKVETEKNFQKEENRVKWWRDENDFPELSYHMNYYAA